MQQRKLVSGEYYYLVVLQVTTTLIYLVWHIVIAQARWSNQPPKPAPQSIAILWLWLEKWQPFLKKRGFTTLDYNTWEFKIIRYCNLLLIFLTFSVTQTLKLSPCPCRQDRKVVWVWISVYVSQDTSPCINLFYWNLTLLRACLQAGPMMTCFYVILLIGCYEFEIYN